ncbi:unnamed protein product [Pleuronectes platessa]|uniref:Uncharacterized protein n=1 Tax=Pleuronectes platessa TaxID=8262 RepID=A0A9N7W3V0_PLEPL|nr:unnamed protein product [Pleuronectes platessa]
MSESAEALAASQTITRNITIKITNSTNNYWLLDPSGLVQSPPEPTVCPLKTELCNFTKTSGKASGAVGVLTYDLFEKYQSTPREKVAIMFSVPYDYGKYKNWVAVGIFPHGKEVNEALFNEMYYNKEDGFKRMEGTGSGLTFEGPSLDIKATMSPIGEAIMKVEVWDKLFSAPMIQQH